MSHSKKPRVVYKRDKRAFISGEFPSRTKLYEVTFEGIKKHFNTIDKCIARGKKLEGKIKKSLSEIKVEHSTIDWIRVELNVLDQVIKKSKKVGPFSISSEHKPPVYIISFEGIEYHFGTVSKRLRNRRYLNREIGWSLGEIKSLERRISLDREELNIVNSVIRSFRISKVFKLDELSETLATWFINLDQTLIRRQRLEHDLRSDLAKIEKLQARIELIQDELRGLDQSVVDEIYWE